MADQMGFTKSFSSDILALVGDVRGAAKVIKTELKDVNKEIKEAEREINRLEKEKEKAKKQGLDVATFDRQLRQQQAFIRGSQIRSESLDERKKRLDLQGQEFKYLQEKLDKSLLNRAVNLKREISSEVIGVIHRLARGEVNASDIQNIGGRLQEASLFAAGKGRLGIAKAAGRIGASMVSFGMQAAIPATVGYTIGSKIASVVQGLADDEVTSAEAGRQLAEINFDLQRQSLFSSALPSERMKEIEKASSDAAKRIEKAYRESGLTNRLMLAMGINSELEAEQKKARAKELTKIRKYVDRFGNVDLERIAESSTIQNMVETKVRESGYIRMIAGNIFSVIGLGDVGIKFGNKINYASQDIQDFFGLGETRTAIKEKLVEEQRDKIYESKEKTMQAALAKKQENPMFKNIQFLYNQHLRALETQALQAYGNAYHM